MSGFLTTNSSSAPASRSTAMTQANGLTVTPFVSSNATDNETTAFASLSTAVLSTAYVTTAAKPSTMYEFTNSATATTTAVSQPSNTSKCPDNTFSTHSTATTVLFHLLLSIQCSHVKAKWTA